MKITRQNYESFFIDYLDGKLDERFVDEFIEFLHQNNDLKEELLLFDNIQLHPEKVVFKNKNSLLREHFDSKKEFEHSAVAYLEGDLTKEESEKFENYLKRKPEKQKDFNLYEKARLYPEPITFPNKNSLYKKPLIRTIFLWSARAAAVLLIAGLASVLIYNQQEKFNTTEEVVVKNEKKTEFQPVLTKPGKKAEKNEPVISPGFEKSTPLKVTTTSSKGSIENTNSGSEKSMTEKTREPVEMIPYLNPLKAGLSAEPGHLTLAAMAPVKIDSEVPAIDEERLLADVLKEKLAEKNFSFTRLTHAGLNLASKLTKDKFTYSTNQKGEVTEYAFESRLLGFSIPAGKK